MAVSLAMLVAGGCSAQTEAASSSASPTRAEATQTARHPVSGLEVIPLSVGSHEQKHDFRVEVALSPMEQARGLMFRTELGPDEGMIFPRDTPGIASFWMKNTPLPLDIIFIGPDGRIINIAANTVPYSLDPVSSEAEAGAVLEIPAGRAAELGIGPGDMVRYDGAQWQSVH